MLGISATNRTSWQCMPIQILTFAIATCTCHTCTSHSIPTASECDQSDHLIHDCIEAYRERVCVLTGESCIKHGKSHFAHSRSNHCHSSVLPPLSQLTLQLPTCHQSYFHHISLRGREGWRASHAHTVSKSASYSVPHPRLPHTSEGDT